MIIAFLSGKGGVGKTSIVANLGVELARSGLRVLLVDADFFTRGLTFLMAKGKYRFDFSFTDLLQSPSSPVITYVNISSNLFLLPSVKYSFESDLESRIREALHGNLQYIKRAIKDCFSDFDFVLIDARSGADYLSTVPALIADKYWIVTEEDLTSQEVSNLLMKIIEQVAKKEKVKATSDGFIVNKSIVSRLKDLVKFLERSVFKSPCISLIPLSRNARKAFLNEELVVDAFPNDVFSREIRAIAKKTKGRPVSSVFNRLTQYTFSDKIIRILYPTILVVAGATVIYHLLGSKFSFSFVLTLATLVTIVIAVLMLYLYSKEK